MGAIAYTHLYAVSGGTIVSEAVGSPFTVTETVDDNVFDIDVPELLTANPGSLPYLGTNANGDTYLDNGGGITFFFTNDVYPNGATPPAILAQDLAICFAKGTLIGTPDGKRRVEDLSIGDTVRTADGRDVAVKWLGVQSLRHPFGLPERLQPVRIGQSALGKGLPHSDLTVTADHGMILDGLVVNASALVNGTSIAFVPRAELPAQFTVYHIETEDHDVILANGAPAETFIDYAGRKAFDNYAEYVDLYGCERIIPEMDRPRISARRLVPDAMRAQLGIPAELEADWDDLEPWAKSVA